MFDRNSEPTVCGPFGPSVSGLIVLVSRSYRALAGQQLAELGLHPGQEFMIQHLRDARLSQRELAERLGVEPPTVTRMVQRLEQAGFVERCVDEHDARISRVRLSQRGRDLRKPVEVLWAALEERTIAGLNDDETEQLSRLLAKVLANLANDRGPHVDALSACEANKGPMCL